MNVWVCEIVMVLQVSSVRCLYQAGGGLMQGAGELPSLRQSLKRAEHVQLHTDVGIKKTQHCGDNDRNNNTYALQTHENMHKYFEHMNCKQITFYRNTHTENNILALICPQLSATPHPTDTHTLIDNKINSLYPYQHIYPQCHTTLILHWCHWDHG